MICSVIQDELQKLLGLRYSLALQNLNGAEIRLAEGLKINEILEQRFDLNLAEVNRFSRCCNSLLRGFRAYTISLRSALL